MANEIQTIQATGSTLYAQIRDDEGNVWNTSGGAFETYATANIGDYDVALTEQGTASGFFVGSIPAAIDAQPITVTIHDQAGGSPAESDSVLAAAEFHLGPRGWQNKRDITV